MAETALTVTSEPAQYSQVGIAVVMASVDVANGNKFAASRDMLLLVQNTDSGAHTFGVTSQGLAGSGRKGDVSQSLAAGEIRVFRMTSDGWADGNGNVLIPASLDSHFKLGVINLAV